MRRKEKEITDTGEIDSIILRSTVCRLAMADMNRPYIVPLCFGYQSNALYFHSAIEGKKLDILKKNNNVCFEFDIDQQAIGGEKACGWSMKYRSVIGFGKATLITDPGTKARALDIIVAHYSDREKAYQYSERALEKTVVIKVDIESMAGKKSGYEVTV